MSDVAVRPDAIIHTVDLKKCYKLGKDNFVDALRCASLDIMRGEMAAIMGPSGSGKSTFMHIAGCLDTPDSGEVWMDGRRIDQLRGADLVRVRRNSIGFIFQGFNLIPTLSAEENVALAAEYAGHSRRESLDARARAARSSWVSATGCVTSPASSRAASSSAWRSRGRSSTTPTSSWATSPPATWTRRHRPRSWR